MAQTSQKSEVKAPEKEQSRESFDWLFIDLEQRIKSYDSQLTSYQSILKKDEGAAELALQELHTLHESGGGKEALQFALRKIDNAAQSKKGTLELMAQLSKQYSDLFERDIEKILKESAEYIANAPQELKVFQETFQKRMQSVPDFVKPILAMSVMKKQVEAREKSPQGGFLKVFSLIRAYLEQERETEKLTRFTVLEKLVFEDPTIDSLEKLREKIPKGDEGLTALIQQIKQMSNSSLGEKIEEMREKNPDPLFRLQLIWDLMEGGERAKEPRVQKFHEELAKFIQSGQAKDIGEAISKINRPDDAMAWERAFRRGRGNDSTINAGAPTSPRALGDLWATDLTQSESRSYLIRKTAEVLLSRGNPEDRAKGRKMLSDFCHDLIEKEKIGSLSELESMNLTVEKKEVFEKSRIMAYQELGTSEERQKRTLEMANAMLADNIKEGLGDGQKISTLRSLLKEQGKNLDIILEQSIYASSSAIAEKTAEEQVQKKFLAVALKYTDIEKLKSESGTSDKDQNQLEALRLLQQSTGAKGLSDETKEWVKWFGEEAIINAALLAVSAGVGNLAKAGAKAGLKLGETTLRKALEQGGRATLQWAGREAVLLGAESLAFHEMNTLLQAGLHGDMGQWYGQSFKEHLKGWGHSYVTLGILKATAAAYTKAAGDKLTVAAKKRAEAGAFDQSGALSAINYMGGLATETTAFQLSSFDKEALSDPKAWVNSFMSVIALRVGGALPHTKALHEATAKALKPENEAETKKIEKTSNMENAVNGQKMSKLLEQIGYEKDPERKLELRKQAKELIQESTRILGESDQKPLNEKFNELWKDSLKGLELTLVRSENGHLLFLNGERKLEEVTITKENAKDVLKKVKEIDLQLNKAGNSYELRSEILKRSYGTVETSEAYTYGEPPEGRLKAYLDDRGNWISERLLVQEKIIKDELGKSQQMTARIGERGIIYALRGNTASGKSTSLKTNDIFKKALNNETGQLDGAVNPDTYKMALVVADRAGDRQRITDEQTHKEGGMVKRALVKRLNTEQSNDVTILDQRLNENGDVAELLKMAQDQKKKVRFMDVDSPFELSLIRVLQREPEGSDPLVPFVEIAKGYKGIRENRISLLKKVIENDTIELYHLYVMGENGESILAAEKRDGKIHVNNKQLFEKALSLKDILEETATLRKTVITSEYIESMLQRIPENQRKRAKKVLEKWGGKTYEQALTEHHDSLWENNHKLDQVVAEAKAYVTQGKELKISEIVALLNQFKIPINQWGKGKAKTFEHLLKEIGEGETELVVENGELVRKITVVNVNVSYQDGASSYKLIEDRQEFRDGRVRTREFLESSLAEKLKNGENTNAAALRALGEELKLNYLDQVTLEKGPSQSAVQESPSYPGLKTRLNQHFFSAALPRGKVELSGYQEVQPDKTTFFVWRKNE